MPATVGIPFSRLIKRDREAKALTQKEIATRAKAAEVRISQSLLSAWEAGDALPSAENASKLAELVGADPVVWLEALAAATKLHSNLPRSPARMIYQATEHLETHREEQFGIWVLGPANLPVLEDPEIRTAWIENMQEGRSYHLIWFLDLVDAALLKAVLPSFAAIAKTAAKRHAQETAATLDTHRSMGREGGSRRAALDTHRSRGRF